MKKKCIINVSLRRVVEVLNIPIAKQYNGYFFIKAPWREERHASVKIDERVNRWIDFGDRSYSGAATQLVANVLDIPYEAADDWLEEHFGSNTFDWKINK